MDIETIIETLREGGIGVLATDTLYGLVGSAYLPDTVDRIYELKQRDKSKPLIVLISDIAQIEEFGIVASEELIQQLGTYWPGPYSIILPCIDDQYEYLSRGQDAIAFRLPDNEDLRALINETGPLVAPSANPEGYPPATTVDEAQKYFGSDVDFYQDGGTLDGKASTLLRLEHGEAEIIRE